LAGAGWSRHWRVLQRKPEPVNNEISQKVPGSFLQTTTGLTRFAGIRQKMLSLKLNYLSVKKKSDMCRVGKNVVE
jgi:hypothetical protein